MSSLSPYARYRATPYFPALDGLRALSIVPVIWHHSSLTPLPGVWGKGPAGVQLFFVISGFLVTTLLLRERDKHGRISLLRFYARRSLRIFPLYYLVFFGLTLQALLSTPSARSVHFLNNWPYFATYTSNWWVNWNVPHGITFAFAWTLAIEEQYYAFWPGVINMRRGWVFASGVMLGLLILSQCVAWANLAWFFPAGTFWRTFCNGLSSSIALGSLMALALHHKASFGWCWRLLGSRAAAALLMLATLGSLFWSVPHLGFHLVLCLWLGACVVRPNHSLHSLLECPACVHIGRLSYSLYLTHFIALGAVRILIGADDHRLVFAAGLPCSLALAWVVHRWIEKPFLRLKKEFDGHRAGKALARTAG